MNERAALVRGVHKNLVRAYKADFGKHSGKYNSVHIEAVFENAASQLSAAVDGSVKRYRFKDVVTGKKNYQDLFGPIEWLVKARLVHKAYIIESEPRPPLKSLAKENFFKLYLFDAGILGFILEMSYKEHKLQDAHAIKGFVAENFVLTEMKSAGVETVYSWRGRNSEIEFIQKTSEGDVMPIEVKSGRRTTAKSLRVYCEKYMPRRTLKLVGAAGGSDEIHMVLPLYYTAPIVERICGLL